MLYVGRCMLLCIICVCCRRDDECRKCLFSFWSAGCGALIFPGLITQTYKYMSCYIVYVLHAKYIPGIYATPPVFSVSAPFGTHPPCALALLPFVRRFWRTRDIHCCTCSTALYVCTGIVRRTKVQPYILRIYMAKFLRRQPSFLIDVYHTRFATERRCPRLCWRGGRVSIWRWRWAGRRRRG